MGQALYRKYRSKSLSEIVGQDHIITTLKNSLKQGRISHAYLFTGPRGVGKTSIARILAHEINELPYNDESVHLDIIEIDAASNRRIDEIRDLRDKVHISPTSAKYKVYIIDEVHMLTREAFNALLKTLEEPPAHAIFILATTEVHKLPETIISRTQRYTFRPIDNTKAVAHLREIATKEKVHITDEALELIATHGDGSFRDSISLLDQVSNRTGKIEADDIRTMLGIAPHQAIEDLYEQTLQGTPQTILQQLSKLQDAGYEPNHLARQLSQLLRSQLLDGKNIGPHASTLLKELIEVPASSDPATKLEIILLDMNTSQGPAPQQETPKAVAVAAQPKITEPAKDHKSVSSSPVTPTKTERSAQEAAPAEQKREVPMDDLKQTDDFSQAWQTTLSLIKTKYNTLYGVLRMAEPRLDGNKLTLACKFAFHQKRLSEVKNRALLSELLQKQLGSPIEVTCIVEKTAKPGITTIQATDDAAPAGASAPLDTISNIFGATEVLES